MSIDTERVGSAQAEAAAAEVLFVGRFCDEGAAGVFLEVSVHLIAEEHVVADKLKKIALALDIRVESLVKVVVLLKIHRVEITADALHARHSRDSPVEDKRRCRDYRNKHAQNTEQGDFYDFLGFAFLFHFGTLLLKALGRKGVYIIKTEVNRHVDREIAEVVNA